MRIFATILSMFLLLPGLCGSIFLPISISSRSDPYIDLVFWLSGIGLAAGIIGVVMLFFIRKQSPESSRPGTIAFLFYVLLGTISVVLVLPGITAIFTFLSLILRFLFQLVALGSGPGLQILSLLEALLALVIGAIGFWLLRFAINRILGNKTANPNAPPPTSDADSAKDR